MGWVKGKIIGPLSGDWSSFCQSWCLSCWLATWIHIKRGHRHNSQRPSYPKVGSGDGVGDRRDAAISPTRCLFIYPKITLGRGGGGERRGGGGGESCSLLRVWFMCFCILLNMPVTKREPTPG